MPAPIVGLDSKAAEKMGTEAPPRPVTTIWHQHMIASLDVSENRPRHRGKSAGKRHGAIAALEFRHCLLERKLVRHVDNAVSRHRFIALPGFLNSLHLLDAFEQHSGSAVHRRIDDRGITHAAAT
jgi:hypothetical protein